MTAAAEAAGDEIAPLAVAGVRKQFPGVVALAGVDFDVHAGEVHVLVGENGAGKSTLIKILSGVLQPDAGHVYVDGTPARLASPAEAHRRGIATIHQESNVVPELSVAENIFIGDLPRGRLRGSVSPKRMHEEAESILGLLDLSLSTKTPAGVLGAHERRLLEIGRALRRGARVLILDEPTAALSHEDVVRLFGILRRLREQGTAIVFISHHLDELHDIGDRVTVLRDGARVATLPLAGTTIDEIIRMMIGGDLEKTFPPVRDEEGGELLRAEALRAGNVLRDVCLSLHAGEIVGVAGLIGSGRNELARALFGDLDLDAGRVHIDGRAVKLRSPRDAIKAGVSFLSADRRRDGLILELPVRMNMTISDLQSVGRGGVLDVARERRQAGKYVSDLSIRLSHVDAPVRTLSGGNQQKVLIARALHRKSRVLIFEEPTLGVDVGAKTEIYRLLSALAAGGAAILVISSDLLELLGETTRVLVMRKGAIVAEFQHGEATQEMILRAASSDAP